MDHETDHTDGASNQSGAGGDSLSASANDALRADGGDGDLHVVLGTGQLGTAIARVLGERAAGDRVRMVNRSGAFDRAWIGHGSSGPGTADVEVDAADLTDPEAAVDACRGARVVYFTAKPPYTDWPTKFPPLLEGALAGAAAADATFVYADNCYMYGPVAGPIHENLPYVADTRKGRTRAAMAERVLTAHAEGEIRTAIGRASDFYGPGVTESQVGERVFARLLDGRPASVLGDPDVPHTYTFIDDFARGLITLGEEAAALGDAWHVPSAPTLTTREFVALVGEVAGTRGRVRTMPSPFFAVLSRLVPSLRELREMRYTFEEPFVVDASKFEAAFGADPTPHEEAIERTLAWYGEHEEAG